MVDLSEYGPVPPQFVTAQRAQMILEQAQLIIDQHSPDWIAAWRDAWTAALAWEAVMEQEVTDSWSGRALLLACVQGLQGGEPPRVTVISQ